MPQFAQAALQPFMQEFTHAALQPFMQEFTQAALQPFMQQFTQPALQPFMQEFTQAVLQPLIQKLPIMQPFIPQFLPTFIPLHTSKVAQENIHQPIVTSVHPTSLEMLHHGNFKFSRCPCARATRHTPKHEQRTILV